MTEYVDHQILSLLKTCGLDAFTGREDLYGANADEVEVLGSGVLRFEYGFLLLVRGIERRQGGMRYFCAVDVHDYRSAVLDSRIAEAAYARLEALATARVVESGVGGVMLGCCPGNGNLYAEIASEQGAPDEGAMVAFWVYYFQQERLRRDLNLAFGDAAVAFAKRAVPDLVCALAG